MEDKSKKELGYTIQELAKMALPSFPSTIRGLTKFMQRAAVPRQRRQGRGGGWGYLLKDMPASLRLAIESKTAEREAFDKSGINLDTLLYGSAVDYNRRKADKYLVLIKEYGHLRGAELISALERERAENPDTPSYPRFVAARRDYQRGGVASLLGRYGNRSHQSTVSNDYFDYFKELFLKEGAPSANSCWRMVAGRYVDVNKIFEFPSSASFLRRLRTEVPASTEYLARHGFQKWNRKFGNYIERDYSSLKAGQCWVSDHAQLDVATELKNRKAVFPWITSFRDMKSCRWLGWILHPDPPNSDHIFQAFYQSVSSFGLPDDLLIDNGRDFRCHDFAGGRKTHCVKIDEAKAVNMLSLLNVTVHFAIPRNAQAKPIERDFLSIKEMLSKHLVGYRGGNVGERPEKLVDEIKSGKILDFNDLQAIFDDFIKNVLNKTPSGGKVLRGRSPDDQWNLENPVRRSVSKDALKLFCMRTSRPVTIGRNGLKDSEFGVRYWAEWMVKLKGRKVYLRRDIKDFTEAWIFGEGDEYLGNAYIVESVPVFVKSGLEKQMLRDAQAAKRREVKIVKEAAEITTTRTAVERVSDMKRAATILNDNPVPAQEQTIFELPNTKMDQVILKKRRMAQHGKADITDYSAALKLDSKRRELEAEKAKIPCWQWEKEEREEKIKRLEEELEALSINPKPLLKSAQG